jgi:hypothetical protein
MPSVLVQSVVSDALFEVNSLSPGEPLDPALGQFVLGRLNQIVDNWNGQREAAYAETFLEFDFVANQQSYGIGPTGPDFIVPVRPVSIEGANVLLNTNPVVRNAINIRDYQFWMTLSVRQVSTTFPTDCYYETDWPNGTLNFYPIPTIAYGLELVTRSLLAPFLITGTMNLPPGYQNAITLTLAEDIAPALGKTLAPTTSMKARQARQKIYVNNDFVPSIATWDYGMPSTNRNRTNWNYLSGLNVNTSR